MFEINRNFRNEGSDSSHSPEFAMLEAYQSYTDYNGMAALTTELVQDAAVAVFGSTTVELADDTELSTSAAPGPRSALYDAVSQAVGREVDPTTEMSVLVDLAGRVRRRRSLRITGRENWSKNCSTRWWSIR